jgi:branched-chain amino acid transport system substrate-binding protein
MGPYIRWSRRLLQRIQGIHRQRTRSLGQPDYYASLQTLEQAIEIAGTERAKVTEALRTQTFRTVVGTFQFTGQVRRLQPLVSQWQSGEFVMIQPTNLAGAKPIAFPKPQW